MRDVQLTEQEYDTFLSLLTSEELERECRRLTARLKACEDRSRVYLEAGYSLKALIAVARENMQIAIQARKLACTLLENELKFTNWNWGPDHGDLIDELKSLAERYENMGISHGRLVNGDIHKVDPEFWIQLGTPKKGITPGY